MRTMADDRPRGHADNFDHIGDGYWDAQDRRLEARRLIRSSWRTTSKSDTPKPKGWREKVKYWLGPPDR